MFRFIGIAVCACWLSCLGNTPLYAQTGGGSGSGGVPVAFSNLVQFAPHTNSATPCSSVVDSRSVGGVPCSFDNGFAPGSPFNSGLLSTQVPAGGAIRLDLTEIQKTWGQGWRRGFNLFFWQSVPLVMTALGLALGFRFVFIWLATWGKT